MTIKERVHQIIRDAKNRGKETGDSFQNENEPASLEKMVYIAYYMGREEATRQVSDAYVEKLRQISERAKECRYKNMAAKIAGDTGYIYNSDYAGEMTRTFGSDRSDI